MSLADTIVTNSYNISCRLSRTNFIADLLQAADSAHRYFTKQIHSSIFLCPFLYNIYMVLNNWPYYAALTNQMTVKQIAIFLIILDIFGLRSPHFYVFHMHS